MLREDQIERYARHILLPDVGGVGQERLLAATIVVDPRDPAERAAFDYLVAAGVGTIALVAPAPALVARAAALNPDVRVVIDPDARGPRLALPDADDDLIRAGAAATALLHRLATTASPPP